MRTCGVSAFLSSRDLMVSPSDLSCLRGGISDSTIHHINERSNVFVPLKHSKCQLSVQCAVRFRPCIDIHKGKVKQIVGSTLRDLKGSESDPVTNFESDKSAAEFAKLYWKDGLTGGHVIMLGADVLSKSAAIEALHAYPGGLQVGGGINSDNALGYLEEGASHIIVTSYVFNNGQMDLERLKDLVHTVGKHRLVLDLSCRKRDERYAIVTDRWQKFTDVHLDKETLNFLATYADEFLVHGVDVEGKRLGIDEELVKLLGMHSPIPVTYAGGVTTMADLEKIKEAGMDRVDVTVGSALDIFGGDLAYNDVVSWHHKQEPLPMAEAFLVNGVKMILGAVAAQVQSEIALARGAKGELKKLQDKLGVLQLVLEDAEKCQAKELSVRHWMEKLKGVAYKAQDVMDDFSYETTRQEMEVPAVPQPLMKLMIDMVLNICSNSNLLLFQLKMAHMIQNINNEFNKIKKEMEYNFIKGNIQLGPYNPRDAAVDDDANDDRESHY